MVSGIILVLVDWHSIENFFNLRQGILLAPECSSTGVLVFSWMSSQYFKEHAAKYKLMWISPETKNYSHILKNSNKKIETLNTARLNIFCRSSFSRLEIFIYLLRPRCWSKPRISFNWILFVPSCSVLQPTNGSYHPCLWHTYTYSENINKIVWFELSV